MIVFGGFSKGQRINDIVVYSFTENAWHTIDVKGEKPEVRSGHSAVVYSGGMWVFGGKDDENNKLNDLWRYDIATKKWQ